MMMTLAWSHLFDGKINKADKKMNDKINNSKCTAEGAFRKLNGGTIGKNLSANHNLYDISFATIQKKLMILMAIIFFETKLKSDNGMGMLLN
jgi:hypothetical protein